MGRLTWSPRVNGVGGAGSGLLEFCKGASRAVDEVGVSAVLEEFISDEAPLLSPGRKNFVVFDIERRPDQWKAASLR